jgi:hypothetical protein
MDIKESTALKDTLVIALEHTLDIGKRCVGTYTGYRVERYAGYREALR